MFSRGSIDLENSTQIVSILSVSYISVGVGGLNDLSPKAKKTSILYYLAPVLSKMFRK